jgi:hypothetical protein
VIGLHAPAAVGDTDLLTVTLERIGQPAQASNVRIGIMIQIRALLRTAWDYLREVSGENEYARYQARAMSRREPAMTPQAFYLWRLRRKYSRISHCC